VDEAPCHFPILFLISIVEVNQDPVFSFQSNEGGSAATFVIVCESILISMEKLFLFTDVTLTLPS
jgi:hypothetical protein